MDTLSPSSETETKSAAIPERWLVVDQMAVPIPRLDDLLKQLQSEFKLDPYTARQRMVGRGYMLFARGRDSRLDALYAVLKAYAIPCSLIVPQRPALVPRKLQGLRVTDEAVTLLAEGGPVKISRESSVVAVLADLSGDVVEKSMKRLLVRNAYQGPNAAPQAVDDTIRLEIARGKPILDLYLIDQNGVSHLVRAYPARFDAAGLGARMSISAAQNLLALLDVIEQFAGNVSVRTDFGLANLPGCQLQRGAEGIAEANSLTALTRFGWVAAEIACVTRNAPPEQQGVLAGNLVTNPLLSPELAAVAAVLSAENGEAEPATATVPVATSQPLPQPPAAEERGQLWSGIVWADWTGAVLGLGFGLIGMLGSRSNGHYFWSLGFGLGIVPGLVSAFCLWRGFHYLSLKRTVQNTPISRIRSLATGMVEISGRAVRRYALVAPMTQLPCVYYQVRRYRRDHKNNWRLTGQSSSGPVPFEVEDSTGRVLVDPRRADLRPGVREEGRGDTGGAGLLFGMGGDADEKWVEEVIPEGATVYVLGFANVRRETRESLSTRTAAKLRDLKGTRALLARFDRNGDGRIDADEWDAARLAMEEEASHEQLAATGEKKKQEAQLVVGRPPRRGLPFIVAQSLEEQDLIQAFSWRSLAFFGGAFVFIIWTCRQFVLYLSLNS